MGIIIERYDRFGEKAWWYLLLEWWIISNSLHCKDSRKTGKIATETGSCFPSNVVVRFLVAGKAMKAPKGGHHF
jgi:hypothetical protein